MACNTKGFVFTLDAFFALVVAGMGISMLMYLQYTSPGIYQTSVQEAYGLLQSTLHESIAGLCGNVSIGNINGCTPVSSLGGAYGFGTYDVPPYQSALQAMANMYINTNTLFAASFNGASSYISTSNTELIGGSNSMSVFAWIYPTVVTGEYEVYCLGGVGANNACLGIYQSKIYFDNGGANEGTSGLSITPNAWHFAGWTYAPGSSNVIFYLDGATGTNTLGAPPLNTYTLNSVIGSYSSSHSYYFQGLISDVQLYSTTLTASQVNSIYAEGIGGLPLSSGLMGWWPLNGNANDYSGTGNTGAPTNVIYNSIGQSAPGPFASALLNAAYPSTNTTMFINNLYAPSINFQTASFNGASSAINAGNSVSLNVVNAITVSAWIYPTGLPVTWNVIAQKGTGGHTFVVQIHNNDLNAGFWTGSQWFTYDSTATFSSNKWYDIAYVFNPSTNSISLYINGAGQTFTGVTGTPQGLPTDSFLIGSQAGSSGNPPSSYQYPFNGFISNMQIYNTALTAVQISQLYKEGITGIPVSAANIVGWWPLDGNSNDYTTYGDTGTAVNVVYNSVLSNIYLPSSLSGSSQVSKASVPLMLNVSGTDGVYNVSVVQWR